MALPKIAFPHWLSAKLYETDLFYMKRVSLIKPFILMFCCRAHRQAGAKGRNHSPNLQGMTKKQPAFADRVDKKSKTGMLQIPLKPPSD